MKIKYTLKAGTILINTKTKKIGLIFRKKHNDYEFPKGHLEKNETLPECAVRETAEETKRDVTLITSIKPYIAKYKTKKGEYCKCYYYFGIDKSHSENTSPDTHKLIWKDFDNVENTISHKSLKILWKKSKNKVAKILNSNV